MLLLLLHMQRRRLLLLLLLMQRRRLLLLQLRMKRRRHLGILLRAWGAGPFGWAVRWCGRALFLFQCQFLIKTFSQTFSCFFCFFVLGRGLAIEDAGL